MAVLISYVKKIVILGLSQVVRIKLHQSQSKRSQLFFPTKRKRNSDIYLKIVTANFLLLVDIFFPLIFYGLELHVCTD